MKTKLSLVCSVLCGLAVSSAAGENNSGTSASGPPVAATEPLAAVSSSTPAATSLAYHASISSAAGKENPRPAQVDSTKKAAPELTESQELEKAKREHIRPASHLVPMETPPPPTRAESKTASPIPGLVWVPGHWTPAKGEWQWTVGEWAVPATAASVWIEPKYDPKTKLWTAGYWQPDRELLYGN